MRAIVDTNVPIVANGKSDQASFECMQHCVQLIKDVTQNGKLVIDDRFCVLREYMANLRPEGQPGVGDAFLKWVLVNQANPDKVERVPITPENPANPNCVQFAEYPDDPALADFDPSDRKFVAVALAYPDHPPIYNAVDSDWWQHRNALEAQGLTIMFLCPDQIAAWDGQ